MNREKKRQALATLEEMYPEAKAELVFSNPYEMMVATILSAQCTDRQVNKVTPAVFARYPDVCSMADAREEDLYPMVKSCGFKTKAANIIAACSPAFAVDTHVFRVSNRIGLCRADTVEETERQMTRLIPREKWGNAHHWLIWHGRRVCKAQHPLCGECGLKAICEYASGK